MLGYINQPCISFCCPSPSSTACAYWSDCHWAVPSDTPGLFPEWSQLILAAAVSVWTVQTVFSTVVPSICQQGAYLLLCCACTQLDRGPWKSLLVLQSTLDTFCYFWIFFFYLITYFYRSLAHIGKKIVWELLCTTLHFRHNGNVWCLLSFADFWLSDSTLCI